MKAVDLAGPWELAPVENFPVSADDIKDWFSMDVPSHWQQHPELGTVSGKVIYRKYFSLRRKKTATYRLVFPGIFYWSTVYLNGKRLGGHEGYFNAQQYDVTELLKSKNEIVVHVDCPDEKVKNDKRMITGVFSHWDCLDPKTNPGGIWLAPFLYESKGAFFDDVLIHTSKIEGQSATLSFKADIMSAADVETNLKIAYTPDTFKGKAHSFEHDVKLQKGLNKINFSHEIAAPRLWWPHDMGRPDLYKVTATLAGSGKSHMDKWGGLAGIRTVEVRDWIYYINGIKHYIKGNNYAPSDTRIATTSDKLVQKDMKLAKDCHMNMLRVHAHVDHPALYEAADRAGVMIWQDFPLQWSYQKEILPIAEGQVARMVRQLYNHPSVVTWCCHNEAIYLVDTKDEDIGNISKSVFSIFIWSWNRDVMDKKLQAVVAAEDPSRFVARSSGEPAVFKKGGDTHFYFGWYRVQGPKRSFERVIKYTPKNLRFVTEFGAQSFPNLKSCEKFMDKDIKKIDWNKLQERNSLQVDLMDHWVGLNKNSLAQLVEQSQEYQSRINQYYIDRLRWKKYEPGGGVVPFMFNDPNPAIQWSVVDYWRVPKKSYFAMQRALAPQYAFVLLDKDQYSPGTAVDIPIYIVNDAPESFEKVRIDMVVQNPEGKAVNERGFELFLPADSLAIEVARVTQPFTERGKYRILLKLSHPEFKLENDYPVPIV